MRSRRTHRAHRAPLAVLGVTLSALALAPSVAQAAYVDDVLEAWQDDPVYVDEEQRSALSESEEQALEAQIGEGDEPIFVAVLPEDARGEGGGTTVGLLRELAQGEGSTATYAAVVGGQFRAGSTSGVDASRMSEQAFSEERGDGVDAVLANFVGRAQGGGSSGGGSGDGDGGGGFGLGGLLVPLLLLVGGVFLVRRLARRRGAAPGRDEPQQPATLDDFEEPELQQVQRALQEDMVALGEDLRTMDIEIQLPDASEQAKARYVAALDSYQRVSAAVDDADTLGELRPLSSELARGRYSLDCTRALLDGKPEPAPRVPCFFDPRHGTSARDVQWVGPQNESVVVPACEICADRVEAGRQPDTRQVQVQGREVPYYEAPQMGPYYGGFFGGMGGGGGSLLSGILLGNMLGGGGLFGGGGFGGGGDSGGGGFGDFGGGGDFGGDFGGGGDF